MDGKALPPLFLSLEVKFGNETHLFIQNKVPPQPPMTVHLTERIPTSGVHVACRMPYVFDFVTELCTQ